MRNFVTDAQLAQLRQKASFDKHQDVRVSKWQFLHVGHRSMQLYWLTNSGERVKEILDWMSLTAEEINRKFASMEWKKTA